MIRQLEVLTFQPKVQITAYTWRGPQYDLTADLVSWQTGKLLTQTAGSFQINLVGREDANGNWADKLYAMDYIEIRATVPTTTNPATTPYPIIMRGFVDSVVINRTFQQSGGPQEPQVQVLGRDYGKLLLVWQVMYLVTYSNQNNMAAYANNLGLYYNFNITTMAATLPAMFQQFNQHMLQPMTQGLRTGWMAAVQDLNLDTTNLPNFEVGLSPVMSQTGPYWNFLQYFASPPFGEIFVWDQFSNPQLVVRATPYKAYDGSVVTPGFTLDPTVTLDVGEMQGHALGRTDTDAYTYYLTWGDSTQQIQMTMPGFATTGNNGVDTPLQSLYGIRPNIQDSAWVNPFDGANTNNSSSWAVSTATTLNEWLMHVMKNNPDFWSGTITVQGRPHYHIGQYLSIPAWNAEYYVVGVAHDFQNYGYWTTTLSVARGRNVTGSPNATGSALVWPTATAAPYTYNDKTGASNGTAAPLPTNGQNPSNPAGFVTYQQAIQQRARTPDARGGIQRPDQYRPY